MQSLVKRLLLWSVRRPAGAALVFALLTLVLTSAIPRLQIDASNEGFMLERDPARQYYEQVKATFGSDELTVVMVKAEDVFTVPALQTIERLSDALQRVEGVTRVDSLATVDNISATEDGLEIAPLLRGGIPDDSARLASLKQKALANAVFRKPVSRTLARNLFIYTQPAEGDKGFNARFCRASFP